MIRRNTLWILLAMLTACGTNKEGELKPLSKVYQNTTARYNGYYNAGVLYDESISQLADGHVDNYNEVLPLYPYQAIDNASGVSGDLDRAIEKATVVVTLHPKSHWADDCYQLVGQSQFLKKDYESAEHTFEYLIQEYHPDKIAETSNKKSEKVEKEQERREAEEIAKAEEEDRQRGKDKASKDRNSRTKKTSSKRTSKRRSAKRSSKSKKRSSKRSRSKRSDRSKKERSSKTRRGSNKKDDDKSSRRRTKEDKKKNRKPGDEEEEEAIDKPSYFMKHQPAYQDGKVWLARTYIARERYDDALFILSQLEEDPYSFDDVLDQVHEVRAQAYLRQKEYDKAITPLQNALEFAESRKMRARMHFILGQLYALQGDRQSAYTAFDNAKKARPGYVMEFHSTLNQVRMGQDANADPIKVLNRMAKEDKYREFLGEIYYALGGVYRERGDLDNMKAHLLKAISFASRDSGIRGDAYLQLGDFAFNSNEYVDAKNYYDTTLTIISEGHSRHYEVSRRRDKLKDISDAIETIAFQDSLIKISQYSPEEQRLLAMRIKNEQESQAKKPISNTNKGPLGPIASNRANIPGAGLGGQSSFFAYNDRAKDKGKRDFTKKWGGRSLTDNWRRSDSSFDGIIDEEEIERRVAADLSDEEVSELLKGVPQDEADLTRAHDIRMKAMFDLGKYYRTNLSDYNQSMAALEDLLKAYPKSPYTAEALYLLYVSAEELGQKSKAQAYRNRLAEYSPLSEYLRLIDQPGYADEQAKKALAMVHAYDDAFYAYDQNDYEGARAQLASLYDNYTLSKSLKSKAALLDAHLQGKESGKEAYMTSLQAVVEKFPGSPEQERAQEILRFLRGDTKVFKEKEEENTRFVLEHNRLHYVLLIMQNLDDKISVNQLRALVSDYNLKYHRLEKLRVGNVFLSRDDTTPILIVRKFKNKDAAITYYKEVKANENDFLPDFEYELLVINQRNYREVLRSKTLEEYRSFFDEHYKPKEKEK